MARISESLRSYTFKSRAPEGTVYTRIAFEEGKPMHVYAWVGKAGNAVSTNAAALSRTISGNLQAGQSIEEVVEWLTGHSYDRPAPKANGDGVPAALSLADAMGQALARAGKLPNGEPSCPACESDESFHKCGCPQGAKLMQELVSG